MVTHDDILEKDPNTADYILTELKRRVDSGDALLEAASYPRWELDLAYVKMCGMYAELGRCVLGLIAERDALAERNNTLSLPSPQTQIKQMGELKVVDQLPQIVQAEPTTFDFDTKAYQMFLEDFCSEGAGPAQAQVDDLPFEQDAQVLAQEGDEEEGWCELIHFNDDTGQFQRVYRVWKNDGYACIQITKEVGYHDQKAWKRDKVSAQSMLDMLH